MGHWKNIYFYKHGEVWKFNNLIIASQRCIGPIQANGSLSENLKARENAATNIFVLLKRFGMRRQKPNCKLQANWVKHIW